jgi:Uma2 family endonuclease
MIEVLSPSDTEMEIREKIALCLENDCREFWVVNPRLLQIQVSTPDGVARTLSTRRFHPSAIRRKS